MQPPNATLEAGLTDSAYATGPLWWQAMTSETGRLALTVGAVSLVGLFVAALLLRRAHRHRGPVNPLTDSDGTATMEFALVFPFLLFFVMTLAQSSMVMGGNYLVHYAAYAAARVAIVQVPVDQPDDPANTYTQAEGRAKQDLIHEAAAIALAPVGGDEDASGGTALAEQFAQGLSDYFAGGDTPPWVDAKAPARLRYAYDNTRVVLGYPRVEPGNVVELIELASGETRAYGTRDPITVFVYHKLNLGVPYANRIFATDRNDGGSGYHRLLKTNCTLTNEGIRDELPPRPNIPRVSLPGELQDLMEQTQQDNN